MFRLALIALMSMTASAFSGSVDPNSKALRKLLSESTLVEGRGLNNNGNNYQYQLNDAIAELWIKYTGCTTVLAMNDRGGNNNNNNNNQEMLTQSSVVSFEIREGCSGPLVGKYAAAVRSFADGYTESMMTEQQWRCETYLENNCGDCVGVDDAYTCYTNCTLGKFDSSNYDLSVCSAYIEGAEDNAQDFDVQRYLECGKLNQNNNNNAAYNEDDYTNAYAEYANFDGKFRVGPYCAADGYSILLGVFYDDRCSKAAPSTVFSNAYGSELPYSSMTLIPKNTCVPCEDPQYEGVARDVCTQSYASAVKCEDSSSSYVTTYGATTDGCLFMNNYMPAFTAIATSSSKNKNSSFNASSSNGSGKAAVAFAWIFAITTLMLGAYSFFITRKMKRNGTSTASQSGLLA